MTISKDGWLSGCKRVDGIPDKVYSQPNAGEGIVCHSIEGDDRIDDIPDRFLSREKLADGNYSPNAASSCMFINPLAGPLIQMYPITASTWTSGNRAANTRLWAVESEGFAGTPLNASQVANMLYLAKEWEEHSGFDIVRRDTLWEHGEVWNWSVPNAGPTACPSNRYLPFYEALANREDEVTKEEFEAFKEATNKRLYQLETQVWGEGEAGIPRDGNKHKYAAMNMHELSSGRVARVAPDHTHTVEVTLK